MVRNVHERLISAPLAQVGGLIDGLASRDDALWPGDVWPPMRLDRPLGVGAKGGHGPIRYTVEAYEPGRMVRFRFDAPRGLNGTHSLDVAKESQTGAVRLRHVLEARLEGVTRLTWPFVFRWLHDALIEDAFDRAENFCASRPNAQRRWPLHVRLLRRIRGKSKVQSLKSKVENRT